MVLIMSVLDVHIGFSSGVGSAQELLTVLSLPEQYLSLVALIVIVMSL